MTPERYQIITETLKRRQPDMTVVTDFVHKTRNLSAIVRTADAVGVSQVHCALSNGEYQAFLGTAKGSHQWVDVKHYQGISAALQPLKDKGVKIYSANWHEKAVDYKSVDYTQPFALLLGAEKHGVSEQAQSFVDSHITVPMVGMVQSFNVSVAAGIILAEAMDQRQQAGLYDTCRLSDADYQRYFFEWAHPKLSQFCQQNALPYPPVDEEGEVIDASAWYENVRKTLKKTG